MRVVARLMFQAVGGNKSAKTLASRYGLRGPHGFGRRFVAGESVADAIEVARQLEASGFQHTLAVLGETAATMADADRATRAHLALFNEIAAAGIGRDVSVKLTQLGLTVDRATCVDNLRRILDGAAAHELFVRIDMEDSRYTQVTFDIFDTLWQLGYRNAGIAVQSYLPRSMADVKRLNSLGARVRLVKGAYREPRKVAYQKKEEVDAAFIEIMQVLLTEGVQPAIATQDPAMLAATAAFAAARSIGADRYEIQMVYGIRRDLQARLAREGHKVRIWVPFGREWFPYLMRRLGERPSNVGFAVRSLLRER